MENRFVPALSPGKKIMLAIAAILAIVVPSIVSLAKAQALKASPRFTFEVASVKTAPQRDYGTYSRPTGMAPEIKGNPARIDFTDVSLQGVICRAYGVRPSEVKAPAWTQERRYDIHATVPADAPKGHIPEMLQNLLADRFQLKIHWATREEPGYLMTVAKGGLKLKEAAPDDPRGRPVPNVRFTSNGQFELHRFTMTDFANSLKGYLGAPVIDNTGVAGEYDIVFDAAPDSMPGLPALLRDQQQSAFPSIFGALRELGLTLTRVSKVPVKHLVVDSALQVPTGN